MSDRMKLPQHLLQSLNFVGQRCWIQGCLPSLAESVHQESVVGVPRKRLPEATQIDGTELSVGGNFFDRGRTGGQRLPLRSQRLQIESDGNSAGPRRRRVLAFPIQMFAPSVGEPRVKLTNPIQLFIDPIAGSRVRREIDSGRHQHGMSGNLLGRIKVFRDQRWRHDQRIAGIW